MKCRFNHLHIICKLMNVTEKPSRNSIWIPLYIVANIIKRYQSFVYELPIPSTWEFVFQPPFQLPFSRSLGNVGFCMGSTPPFTQVGILLIIVPVMFLDKVTKTCWCLIFL